MSLQLRRTISSFGLHILVFVGALMTIIPFVWMVLSSFKSTDAIFSFPPQWIPETWLALNYRRLFTEWPFARWYANSVSIAAFSTLAVLFFSSLGGFGFAKYNFRGRGVLFTILIGSLMIPFQLILIPLFIIISRLGWVDSYAGLVVPFMAPAFGIFLMKQFMASIPTELIEAARIDGSSEFGTYWRIVVPLLKPAIGALAITTFLGSWNSFLWPLVVLRTPAKLTLTVGLRTLLAGTPGAGQTEYGVIMAAATLVSLPVIILFLAMQRQFVAGLTIGSVKQ